MSRSSVRLAFEVASFMWMPVLIVENNRWSLSIQLNPVALAINSFGSCPPSNGSSYVFQANGPSICVKYTRLLSREKLIVCFLRAVFVSWKGWPSGRDLNQTWPVFVEIPKLPGPRTNATSLPSRDRAGISAESLKFVSCSQRRAGSPAFWLWVKRGHNSKAAAIKAQTPVPPIESTSHHRGRLRSGTATATPVDSTSRRRRSTTNSLADW